MISYLRPVSMACPSASAAQSPRTDTAPALHVVPTEEACRHVEEPTRCGFFGSSEVPPPPPAA